MSVTGPRYSVIIPVHHDTEHLLRPCLNSIFEQDYTNYEVIVIQDGRCDIVDETVNRYAGVKLLVTGDECRGAPVARNMGARKANGDLLLFFDADSRLKPGALSLWVDTFAKNPEAAFVYGGYRFSDRPNYIPAQPFDPYMLTVQNYIGTMNPVRREWAPEWDESLKSLQDWDFWLSVVDKGGKGVMVEDFLVVTEYPDDDSVSGDSAANWLERAERVKAKHGILIRDICICSLGAPQHARRLAELVGADFNNSPWYKPNRYRVLVNLGFYVTTSGGIEGHAQLLANTAPDTQLVNYWIGEDVTQMRMLPHYDFLEATNFFRDNFRANFVEYEGTRAEVEDEFGIPCHVMPLPVVPDGLDLAPYPEQFTVAFYHGMANKYKVMQNLNVASQMPDVRFLIYGNAPFPADHKAKLPPNVEFRGFVPSVPDLIRETSCLLRTAEHDGFCVSHCEWIMAGRHVISDLPHRPGALCVPPNPIKVIDAIRDVQARANGAPDEERVAMRQQYIEMLRPEPWVEQMRSFIN